MSIAQPNKYDLHEAALRGLGSVQGDPEVLQDLGIPVTEDDLYSHLDSAEQFRTVKPATAETAAHLGRVINQHQEWVDSFHLTHPSSEGPIVRSTPQEMERRTEQVANAKAIMHKLDGSRPGKQ